MAQFLTRGEAAIIARASSIPAGDKARGSGMSRT